MTGDMQTRSNNGGCGLG